MELDDITGEVVDAAINVHRRVGPGLLETVYESVLTGELRQRGLKVERQRSVTIDLDGVIYEDAFRVDLIVEGAVVVEVKSVERLAPVHRKQLLTYLRLLDMRVGLVLNFREAVLKDGLVRVVNQFVPCATSRLRVNSRGV